MMNTEFPKRSVGATTDENGNVLFRVWSPQSTSMQIVPEDGERIAMKRDGEYWTETIKNTEMMAKIMPDIFNTFTLSLKYTMVKITVSTKLILLATEVTEAPIF